MTGVISPYCSGGECHLKFNCARYKTDIIHRKEAHFAFPPYDPIKKKCGFYIGADGENILNEIHEILNNKKGGGKNRTL